MTHKTRVRYKHEYLRAPALPGWSAQVIEGRVFVSGPCPHCGGDAGGPGLNAANAVAQNVKGESREVEVAAECRCGFAHGEDGKSSCGRYWVVRTEVSD